MDTPRADALFNYVATIAFDRRVQAAVESMSIDRFTGAVWACMKEDAPEVFARIASELRRFPSARPDRAPGP